MRKLKLNFEDLTVSTFETGGAREASGTVHARSIVPTIVIDCPATQSITRCSNVPLVCVVAVPADDDVQ